MKPYYFYICHFNDVRPTIVVIDNADPEQFTPELNQELGCTKVTVIPFNPLDFLAKSYWFEPPPRPRELQNAFDGLMKIDASIGGDGHHPMVSLLQAIATHFYNLGRQHGLGERTA